MYDENWAEKQIYAFTVWLNQTFYPAEYSMYTGFIGDKNDRGSKVQVALNDDILSAPGGGAPAVAEDHFKVLLQNSDKRKFDIERTVFFFHSQELSSIRYALDKEVAEEKLKVRTDRELYADLGLRSEIIEMMMSYNPVWLRLGLEITYGEVIPMTKKALQDAGRSTLKVFLKERLLQDPETTERFKATKLGAFGKEYVIAVAQKLLQRFLTIVLFLDRQNKTMFLKMVHVYSIKVPKSNLVRPC